MNDLIDKTKAMQARYSSTEKDKRWRYGGAGRHAFAG
jgi:hypothetical protein